MIAMTKKTARNYYALNWKEGSAFDTITKLDFLRVANVIAFKKKQDRDDYVDHRHNAESIPASIARKLAEYIGVVYLGEGHER